MPIEQKDPERQPADIPEQRRKDDGSVPYVSGMVAMKTKEIFQREKNIPQKKSFMEKFLEIPDGKITIYSDPSVIAVRLKNDHVLGEVICAKTVSGNLMAVESSMATGGFGPLLYDIAIEVATEYGCPLVSDRTRVSSDAYKIWKYYYFRRPDVEKIELDVGEWNMGRNAKRYLRLMTEDPSTWPDKTVPIWSLWTGYKKKPINLDMLRRSHRLEEAKNP